MGITVYPVHLVVHINVTSQREMYLVRLRMRKDQMSSSYYQIRNSFIKSSRRCLLTLSTSEHIGINAETC